MINSLNGNQFMEINNQQAQENWDILIKNGCLIDPAQQINAVLDVGLKGGNVVAIANDLPAASAQLVLDAEGAYVVPGFIDLHTHIYWGGTSLGVETEAIAKQSGVTTFVDAGSAGAGNILGFKAHIADQSLLKIFAFVNIAFPGIFGFSRHLMVGECEDLRLLHKEACQEAIQEYPDFVRGIKVRVGVFAGGQSGIRPLEIARQVADEVGLPIMTHIDSPPPTRQEILSRLREGDVLTHCFRAPPNAPIENGEIIEEMHLARKHGVLFDIGHGGGSFDFSIGRQMIEQGFEPDIISSDVHSLSVDGPVHDLLTTMSKFLNLGMPLDNIIASVAHAPAQVLKRNDLGSLALNTCGDVVVLDIENGQFEFFDSHNHCMKAERAFKVRHIVLNGKHWHSQTIPK